MQKCRKLAKLLATPISNQQVENQDYFENSIDVLALIWGPEVSCIKKIERKTMIV